MARTTRVVTICDLHKEEVEAAGTVEIAIDGERRKLDVCADHLAELRSAMKPWFSGSTARRGGARKAKKGSRKATGSSRRRRNPDAPAVRAWAVEHGYDVPARGRLPAAVREAYEAAVA